MKTFIRVMSYLATALLACALTLHLCTGNLSGVSKLDQVKYLIETRFIGEADMEQADDAAAKAMKMPPTASRPPTPMWASALPFPPTKTAFW